jgi:carboxyl-terminal processing protease
MSIRELEDGRVLAAFILEDGPAAQAGILLRAEIIAVNGQPVHDFVDAVTPWSSPFSTQHTRRLQQLHYALRSPVGTKVEVAYRNPSSSASLTAILTSVRENKSFNFSSFSASLTGFELPLEHALLESGYGYVKLYSFFDNDLLTVQLWERLIQTLNQKSVPGLIIDLRQNRGGNGFLADQMAAYFFDQPLELGNTGRYDEELNDFYFDPRTVERFYLPAPDLRYHGKIAALIGPNCSSACEFFAYDLTLQERAVIVGHYPTAGLGGSVDQVLMPENELFQFTIGRAVDMKGEIHVEGKGVAPTVRVSLSEETLFDEQDAVLDAAIDYLDRSRGIQKSDTAREAAPVLGIATVHTGGARLRVRSEPSLNAPIIGHALNGAAYPVVEINEAGAWVRIRVPDLMDSESGWVYATYVTIRKE